LGSNFESSWIIWNAEPIWTTYFHDISSFRLAWTPRLSVRRVGHSNMTWRKWSKWRREVVGQVPGQIRFWSVLV
jgi:hypothetical protein